MTIDPHSVFVGIIGLLGLVGVIDVGIGFLMRGVHESTDEDGHR